MSEFVDTNILIYVARPQRRTKSRRIRGSDGHHHAQKALGVRWLATACGSKPPHSIRAGTIRRMRKARPKHEANEMRPHYDFSAGVRGKYAARFPKDAIMVVLDSDVAEVFRDARSVNSALRALVQIIRELAPKAGRRRSTG